MKLFRWAVAGASVYAIYKYSTGKKAKGENILVSPEREIANLTQDGQIQDGAEPASAGPPKPAKRSRK